MTNWIWSNLGTISLLESYTEEGVIILDVRDLSDVESEVEAIKKKIIIGINLMCLGQKVAVRCIAGMNRSNAIALGMMCIMVPKDTLDETFDYHLKELKKKVPRAFIFVELQETIKQALREIFWHDDDVKGHPKHL